MLSALEEGSNIPDKVQSTNDQLKIEGDSRFDLGMCGKQVPIPFLNQSPPVDSCPLSFMQEL